MKTSILDDMKDKNYKSNIIFISDTVREERFFSLLESMNKKNNTMNSKFTTTNNLEKIGAIAGILSIIFYISAAAFSFLPNSVSRLFGFAFPLLWIISFMGLHRFLKKESQTATIEIAYVFGIIGAAIACSLIVIQQANMIWHRELMASVSSDDAKALLKAIYRAANRVQAGLDVTFDIFITISWILFGLNIARSQSFNKILGWMGSLIALLLLVLNLYTFPNGPAEAGLFDFGPLLGLWALIFYTWFAVVLFKKENTMKDPINI